MQAAKGGHLDVLKYAHKNRCPWDERTCISAAGGGHLKVLKYAHENGCPWNEGTSLWAAEEGHLDVLKYARENGCPWDKDRCLAVVAVATFRNIQCGGDATNGEDNEMMAWIQSQPP